MNTPPNETARLLRAQEIIEEMDRIHHAIMDGGPTCACGGGDEWCRRCAMSSKLSNLAHAEIKRIDAHLAPLGAEGEVTDTEMLDWVEKHDATVTSDEGHGDGPSKYFVSYNVGNRNERITKIFEATTVRDAIRAAMRTSKQEQKP